MPIKQSPKQENEPISVESGEGPCPPRPDATPKKGSPSLNVRNEGGLCTSGSPRQDAPPPKGISKSNARNEGKSLEVGVKQYANSCNKGVISQLGGDEIDGSAAWLSAQLRNDQKMLDEMAIRIDQKLDEIFKEFV